MKKTYTLSISGRIFQVEEDAYAMLLDYLESLSQVFHGTDGKEIVADIESRISEIFQEKADAGQIVFGIADAEEVIAVIGDASQLAEDMDDEETAAEQAEARAADGSGNFRTPPLPPSPMKKKLYRSDSDKVLGGVFGGLSIRFGVSALPMRLIAIILMFSLGFFPIFLIYCIAWAIIPLADTPEKILEQKGVPVTVSNIGKVVAGQGRIQTSGGGNTFLRVLGALSMGFLGLIAFFVGMLMFIMIVVIFVAMIGANFNTELPFIKWIPAAWEIPGYIAVCLSVLIPCIAVIWAACSVLFKVKGAGKAVWLSAIIVETVSIITVCCYIALFSI